MNIRTSTQTWSNKYTLADSCLNIDFSKAMQGLHVEHHAFSTDDAHCSGKGSPLRCRRSEKASRTCSSWLCLSTACLPCPPSDLPEPRMHLILAWEEVYKANYQPILRPRFHEPLTDSELLANEFWCLHIAKMMRRRVINYMSVSEQTIYHQAFTEMFPNGHEVFLQAVAPESRRTNLKVKPCLTMTKLATQKALGIPELLEAILRAAAPTTRLSAYSVSLKWRDVTAYIWSYCEVPQIARELSLPACGIRRSCRPVAS
jgi:hypothetical protein